MILAYVHELQNPDFDGLLLTFVLELDSATAPAYSAAQTGQFYPPYLVIISIQSSYWNRAEQSLRYAPLQFRVYVLCQSNNAVKSSCHVFGVGCSAGKIPRTLVGISFLWMRRSSCRANMQMWI